MTVSFRDRLVYTAAWITLIGFVAGLWALFGWGLKELIAP